MALLHICPLGEDDLSTVFGHTLDWYHQSSAFPSNICKLEPLIVAASLEVYRLVHLRLRPIPGYPQYVFSLRDMMSVLQGMCLQTADDLADSVDSAENEHTRLWAHEVLRVFYDRIRDDDDREWFLEMIKSVTKEKLKMDFDELFKHLDQDGDSTVDSEELRRLFFGHYLTAGVTAYDEMSDFAAVISELRARVRKFEQWGQRSSFISISLYQAEHVTRICRVLQLKRGHMLLIGSSGVGKRSMVRLSANMSAVTLLEFDPDGAYNDPPLLFRWRKFLCETIINAGSSRNGRFVLLLRASVMTDEMLEDLNCLLNGVDVPGLFMHAHQVDIVSSMRTNVGAGDKVWSLSIAEMFSFFVQLAYDMLHVCFCVDSQYGNLQALCARFPCLISRCTVNWLQPWPDETMESIATQLLSGTQNTHLTEEYKEMQKAGSEENNASAAVAEESDETPQADSGAQERERKSGHGDGEGSKSDKGRSKAAASLLNRIKAQIEKENAIRRTCGRLHRIAIQVNRQFMQTWGRSMDHISTTHFTYLVKSFRGLLLQRRELIDNEIAELTPTIAQVNKVCPMHFFLQILLPVTIQTSLSLINLLKRSIVDCAAKGISSEIII